MTAQDVSLVIISRNRARFLERGFRYLASTGFNGEIFLGDSSEKAYEVNVANVVERYSERLKINVTFYGAMSPPITRLGFEFNKVNTCYCAWLGDDDFLITDALNAAAGKLSNDRSAVAAVGKSMIFENSSSDAFGTVNGLGPYTQRAYTQSSPEQRLHSFAAATTALTYSLQRTSFTQHLYQEIRLLDLPDDIFGYYFFDLMNAMITLATGKVISIDRLLMVRQAHAKSTSASGNLASDWPSFLNGEQFSGIHARCVQTLASALREANPALGSAADLCADTTISRCISGRTLRLLANDRPVNLRTSLRTLIARRLKQIVPRMYASLKYWNVTKQLSQRDRDHLRKVIAEIENDYIQIPTDGKQKIVDSKR